MRNTLPIGALAVLLTTLVNGTSPAQSPATQGPERADGISVFGTGEAKGKPNLVEIDMRSSGAAELAGDAIVKYRDNKRRIIAAIQELVPHFSMPNRTCNLTRMAISANLSDVTRGP